MKINISLADKLKGAFTNLDDALEEARVSVATDLDAAVNGHSEAVIDQPAYKEAVTQLVAARDRLQIVKHQASTHLEIV